MIIEIHQPELEALIEQQMASGRFRDVEQFLMAKLRPETANGGASALRNRNFVQFMRDSPLYGLDLEFERQHDDGPRLMGPSTDR